MVRVAGANNRRHERRRKVEYLLTEKKEEITREPIDEKTIVSLLESLEKGAVCQFGLLKLSGFLIDTVFPTPSQYLLFPFSSTTLCELASWRRKNAIVANLLRAGSNPSISFRQQNDGISGDITVSVQKMIDEVEHLLLTKSYPPLSQWAIQSISRVTQIDALTALGILKVQIEENSETSFEGSTIFMNLLNEQTYKSHSMDDISIGHMEFEERDVLSSLQRPYQVWVVNKVVSMRVGGASNDLSGTCPCCHKEPALLKWAGKCGHSICEECVWHCLSPKVDTPKNKTDNSAAAASAAEEEENEESYECHGYRLRCPQCSSLCDDDEDEIDCSADYSTQDIAELKSSSLHQFYELPETVSELTSKMKTKGRKFRALNFNQVAGNFIGSVQTVRTAALVRAVGLLFTPCLQNCVSIFFSFYCLYYFVVCLRLSLTTQRDWVHCSRPVSTWMVGMNTVRHVLTWQFSWTMLLPYTC